MKWLNVVLLSLSLGFHIQAEAQQRTLADFVETWERTPDAEEGSGLPDDPKHPIYRRLVIRPDRAVLATVVSTNHGDTLAVTTKGWLSCFDCGGRIVVPSVIRGDTLFWPGAVRSFAYPYPYQDSAFLVLRGQELVFHSPQPGRSGTYRRAAKAKHALDDVIRRGYGPSRPVPAHPQPLTGTLADLVGTWELLPGSNDSTKLRQVRIFRSDSVLLEIQTRRDGPDTLTGASSLSTWKGWRRTPNDSAVYASRGTVTFVTAVLREHQLTFYNQTEPVDTWKAIDWPKRP